MLYKPSLKPERGPLPDMIISDLDGTLTHTSRAAARLASVGDKWDVPLSKMALWVLKTGHKAYRALGQEFDTACGLKNRIMERLSAEQEDSMFMLSAAHERSIPCHLLSNGPRDWGNNILKKMHLRPFFDQVVFREDGRYLKPDPRCLEGILSHSKDLPKKASIWIFGDRVSDVLLAANANAKSAGRRYIPVAIEGTNAADAIRSLNRCDGENKGLVFADQYKMACYIRPETEFFLEKMHRFSMNVPEHVDSYRPA